MTQTEDMRKITEFITPGSTVYLATAENNTPHVRPFQFQFELDGSLWFCTASTKDVYHQIRNNPQVEFAMVSPEYVTMRIKGTVQFRENSTVKEKIIRENELIRSIYREAANPVFVVFSLDHGDAKISYLTGEPDTTFSF